MRVFKMEDEAFVIHTQVCVNCHYFERRYFQCLQRKVKKKGDKHCINWRNILCINEQ